MRLQPFLTAYDPSDLPGGSIDPLGFEREYLFLADKVLPGLTNVASRPRHFSTLCAAVAIADGEGKAPEGETPRGRYERRLGCVQRFGRFWALGRGLASREDAAPETRQVTCCVGGIDGNVLEPLHLAARDSVALSPRARRRDRVSAASAPVSDSVALTHPWLAVRPVHSTPERHLPLVSSSTNKRMSRRECTALPHHALRR